MTGVEPGTGRSPRAGRPSASVLMVLYYFPPIGGVSMARNVANVRYLPAHGWTPVVLGARTAGDFVDAQASALVPSAVRVIRAWCPEAATLGPAVGFVRGVGARRRRSPGARSDDPSVASAVDDGPPGGGDGGARAREGFIDPRPDPAPAVLSGQPGRVAAIRRGDGGARDAIARGSMRSTRPRHR